MEILLMLILSQTALAQPLFGDKVTVSRNVPYITVDTCQKYDKSVTSEHALEQCNKEIFAAEKVLYDKQLTILKKEGCSEYRCYQQGTDGYPGAKGRIYFLK